MSFPRRTYEASAFLARQVVAVVAMMLVLGPAVSGSMAMCVWDVSQEMAPVSDAAHAGAAQAASEAEPVGVTARSQSAPAPLLHCAPLAGHLANQKATTSSLRSMSDELSDAFDLLASSALPQLLSAGSSVDDGVAPAFLAQTSLSQPALRDLSSVVLLL